MKKKNYKQVKKQIEKTVEKTVEKKLSQEIVEPSPIDIVVTQEQENAKMNQDSFPLKLKKDGLQQIMIAIVTASILGIVICGFMHASDILRLVKNCFLIGVFDFIVLFYIQISKDRTEYPSYSWWLIGGSLLGSILLLCNPYEISSYPFWLIGIVLIAAYTSVNLSLLFCYGLIVVTSVMGPFDLNLVVTHILLGSFMCLMARYLSKVTQLFYALILVCTMNITLLFVMNEFDLDKIMNQSIGFMLLADVSVLVLVWLTKVIFSGNLVIGDPMTVSTIEAENLNEIDHDAKSDFQPENKTENLSEVKPEPISEVKNEPISDVKPELISQVKKECKQEEQSEDKSEVKSESVSQVKLEDKPEEKSELNQEADSDYERVMEAMIMKEKQLRTEALLVAVAPDAPLLLQMKTESEKLYRHSQIVANLSRRAALYVGGDAELACAGGWYHEIGRLLGKDYIDHGVTLILDHRLPKEIADIIIQHNFKQQLPQTMEAAIVMLTDNIVSTIQYVRNKMDSQITPDKVIENTFLVRMNKGILNEANITLAEFTKLKEFYLSIVEELK